MKKEEFFINLLRMKVQNLKKKKTGGKKKKVLTRELLKTGELCNFNGNSRRLQQKLNDDPTEKVEVGERTINIFLFSTEL